MSSAPAQRRAIRDAFPDRLDAGRGQPPSAAHLPASASQPSTVASGSGREPLVIDAADVSFAYGTNTVVADISLRARAGELICIVGANGAGKTTLLRLLGGLLTPTRGQVRVFGLDPARTERRALAKRLAYVPQTYRLAFPFTVSEVVLMGRYAHRRRGLLALENAADVEAARAAMDRCDIVHLAERRFDSISGGEQRRALLAQAFCQHTELILLDEPTAALDPAHAIAVLAALTTQTRERGATVVVITHDLNLAARCADRAIILHRGQRIADGRPAEVLASPAATRAFDLELYVGQLPGTALPFAVPR